MTFCVAAECEHDGRNAIVCVTDRQGTRGDFVQTEDAYKFRYFGRGTVMVAGDLGTADEIVASLGQTFIAFHDKSKPDSDFDLRISWLLSEIRKKVAELKRTAVERHLTMTYSITREEFLVSGKDWFSPHERAAVLSEIRNVGIGADLIYAYAEDFDPIIIEITNKGDVIWQDHYACIGSGSAIGLAILAQDDWYNSLTLMDCAARVLLAKWAAERDPYVSKGKTQFDLLVQGVEEIDDFSDAGFEYLARMVKRIHAPSNLEFKAEFIAATHTNLEKEEETQKEHEAPADETPRAAK